MNVVSNDNLSVPNTIVSEQLTSKRTQCVICYGDLEFFIERINFPITINIPKPTQKFKDDIFSDQQFYKCIRCDCVQLGTLIDPTILYESDHNNAYNTPTWKEHHLSLCKFIAKGTTNKIIEIGANGFLLEMLSSIITGNIEYSCLNLCNPHETHKNINYILGDCEKFPFLKDDTIIMSHVFEHLLNPRKFLENINKCEVESVYISIPIMESIFALSNEHTFYIDKYFIEYLFSNYNYQLSDFYKFKNHSLFFYFKRNINIKRIGLLKRHEISSKIYNMLNINEKFIINPNVAHNVFISPAGAYGQMLCYVNNKLQINGFLDNDNSKKNNRVYGTPFYVFGFDELLKYNDATIYLFGGVYNNEIVKQIRSYNKNFEIIELDT